MMRVTVNGTKMELVNVCGNNATILFENPSKKCIVKLNKNDIINLIDKSECLMGGRAYKKEKTFSVSRLAKTKMVYRKLNETHDTVEVFRGNVEVTITEHCFGQIFDISGYRNIKEANGITGRCYENIIGIVIENNTRRNRFNKFFSEVYDRML